MPSAQQKIMYFGSECNPHSNKHSFLARDAIRTAKKQVFVSLGCHPHSKNNIFFAPDAIRTAKYNGF